jgi:histidine triad (HIT) family protein
VTDTRECPFCRIIRGEAPAEVVGESSDWLALFPDTPAVPGHRLVVPRQHVRDFLALDALLGARLMAGVVRVGRAVQAALSPDGMNLISSAGEAAEQSVLHLHLHVVPRRAGDRVGRLCPRDKTMDEKVKQDLAEQIREACRTDS